MLKPDDGEQRYLIGDNGPVNITRRATLGRQQSTDPWLDSFDVGFAELSASELRALLPARPVSPAAAERGDEPGPDRSVLAAGYPLSRAVVRHSEGLLKYTPFIHHTFELPHPAYDDLGISPYLHIAVEYDRRNISRVGDPPRQGVAPKGMSGGGIWRHAWESGSPTVPGPLLTGIIIGNATRSDRVLVGTRVWALHRALVTMYPELAAYIPLRTDEQWTVRRARLHRDGVDH